MGWNGSERAGAGSPHDRAQGAGKKTRTPQTPPSKSRGLLALLIIVVGGLAAWFALRPAVQEETEEPESTKPTKISEVKPQIVTNNAVAEPAKEVVVTKLPDGRPSIPLRLMTPKQRRAWLDQARTEEAIALGRTNEFGQAIFYKSPFNSSTEEVLAQIFSVELGDTPPAIFPQIPDVDYKNFENVLISMGKDNDDDDDDTKKVKENLREVRKMLAGYIGNGGKPEDFIDYYRGQLVQANEQREDATRMFREMFRNRESPENIRAFYDSANKLLSEKGIKPLSLTPRMKELMQYDKEVK